MSVATSGAHRVDVDWLRVFATYMLIPFHVGMVFNPAPFFHIRNDEQSFAMLIFCAFVGLWHMPLFFLLAGWSAHASLRSRGVGGFLRERFFRLVVPLLFACVFLMPVIKYLELRSGLDANLNGLFVAPRWQESFREIFPDGPIPLAAEFHEPLVDFLPTFFTDPSRFTWAHMWFVVYLLVFTVLYLPILRVAARRDSRTAAPIAGWIVYLPILPLALVQVFLRPHWPGLQNLYDDWANFAYYSIFFLAGFALARDRHIETSVRENWRRSLVIALGATLMLLAGVLGAFSSPSLMLAGTAVAGWCFVLALCGFARTRFQRDSGLLRVLAESAFPVYLLHQSAIVICGYWIIQLPLSLGAKLALLLVVSALVTAAVYWYGVRPFRLARFLCGMKAPREPRRGVWLGAPRAVAPLLVFLVVLVGPPVVSASGPLGLWYAENGAARVELRSCGGEICGQIVWLRAPFDENGCELSDENNPDSSLRDRPLLGLEILRGLRGSSDEMGVWEGGAVYDPTSGRTYSAVLRLDGDNRLELRGYIGVPILGRSAYWIRVGTETRLCSAAATDSP